MNRATRARRFTAKELQRQCKELHADLLVQDLATAEECDAYPPGEAENSLRGLDAWIYAFHQFGRLWAHQELQQHGVRSAANDERTRKAVEDAMQARPVSITLTDGVTRAVHPKSYQTRSTLEGLNHGSNKLS